MKILKKLQEKKGFTLIELVIVLVIMVVLASFGIPSAVNYIKQSDFRKNEANAKTVYMAAESSLTWYRNSGQWDVFKREVIHNGIPNTSFSEGDERKDRIYAITIDRNSYGKDKNNLVYRLLDSMSYDEDFFNAAMAIEIDVETGKVYSAFYGTNCTKLVYGTASEGELSMDLEQRDYDKRKNSSLGYYSTEDITNVVDLEPTRLKVTSINMSNGETLSLSWSSNSRHNNMDIDFMITFKRAEDESVLFSTVINLANVNASNWSTTGMAGLTIRNAANEVKGEWNFPLIYNEGTFTLVLDAMMSAEMIGAIDANGGALQKTSDFSITRLASITPVLAEAQNIYATITASSTYKNMDDDTREYRTSSEAKSNTVNTLFADGTQKSNDNLKAYITQFRHLSNIRYVEEEQAAEFVLNTKRMNWTAEDKGYYVYESTARGNITYPRWKSTSNGAQGKELDFPIIERLSIKHTLKGRGNQTLIMNLKIGEQSVLTDEQVDALYGSIPSENRPYIEFFGLFGSVEGTIENVKFNEPKLTLTDESGNGNNTSYKRLKGAGLLCGISSGKLSKITVDSSKKETVKVLLGNRTTNTETIAIGGIVGIIKDQFVNGFRSSADQLVMNGEVIGYLPKPEIGEADPETAVTEYAYGIGGIFGYAVINDGFVVTNTTNKANVTGNLLTGGIGGQLCGGYDDASKGDSIRNCRNEGLVLCDSNITYLESDNELEGRYFGGILGLSQNAKINNSKNAAGKNRKNYYDSSKKYLLNGHYVGGIAGYGMNSMLLNCSTEKASYVMGADYVGGIVGGIDGNLSESIYADGTTGTNITENAGYVIGKNYVGGIIGKNESDSIIKNCVNSGIAAGYGRYIGGIVGYNSQNGRIDDCASYFSDFDNSVFDLIVGKWGSTGDYTGGLVGYNNGIITFRAENQDVAVKSISSIVVGRNCIGGVVGFNDVDGILDVDYTLIGGRVYAYGDAAGGCIGLNASPLLLTKELSIKPTSVRGRYYVGGSIGANIVAITDDIVMDGFEVNNNLGNITGVAFTGGVIGYQRTYTKEQLDNAVRLAGIGDSIDLKTYLELENPSIKPLLPQLDDNNIPTDVLVSSNDKTLTITRTNNSTFSQFNNNVPVQAYLYAGGVVGYCEQGSELVLVNCKNMGRLSLPSDKEFADAEGNPSPASRKVNLKAFLLKYLEGREDSSGMTAVKMLEDVNDNQMVTMIGGISGVNLEKQVIDHCVNTGSISGFTALGGIVGTNAGRVFNCELLDNLGSAQNDGIGGIVGINLYPLVELTDKTYVDYNHITWSENAGTIVNCKAAANKNILGKNYVGGIAGFNLYGAVLKNNISEANISAAGSYIGGIAGSNAGFIFVKQDTGSTERKIESRSGNDVGGLVGLNEETGSIQITDAGGTEVVAVGTGVKIIGNQYVGGIVGSNFGKMGTDNGTLSVKATEIRALKGYAGGIAGRSSGNMENVVNRSTIVTSNDGYAGGIVAEAQKGMEILACHNYGSVNSDNGYAGGIAAVNYGILKNSSVSGDGNAISIRSRNVAEVGALCAINHEEAVIDNGIVGTGVTLSGTAGVIGGITGVNKGIIQNIQISVVPAIAVEGSRQIVGGITGSNQNTINNVQVGAVFADFDGYRYLGGIAGENAVGCVITNAVYSGKIETNRVSVEGNCYGGITGNNSGMLSACTVDGITITIPGVYTATSTSSAEQKEALASHVGAISGKNEQSGVIESCYLNENKVSNITVGNGMAGVVTGYNKGLIRFSGDSSTKTIMGTVDNPVSDMNALFGKTSAISADNTYVSWGSGKNIEALTYSNGTKVTANRSLIMIMSTNGNLGGITAYNAPVGVVEYCVTGNWFLNNKSDAIGVGTGGIIGMNESVKNLKYLVNKAFVGRQLGSGKTNRFAGGIIGNQNITQSSDWVLSSCINYGTIYAYNTHYAGGILGQWTSAGGKITDCHNYGNLQTTYKVGWRGAAAGIVAQLYHPYEENEYNIISCSNHGKVYGHNGTGYSQCANDSAGILGNITAYRIDSATESQHFTVQVLDCLNDAGVEIYAGSMASGIVGYISCDNPTTDAVKASSMNLVLRIERCRNFATKLFGEQYVGGIFGDRYGTNATNGIKGETIINDCYSVSPNDTTNAYNKNNCPIVSLANGSSISKVTNKGNYFFDRYSFTTPPSYVSTGQMSTNVAGFKKVPPRRVNLITFSDGKRYAVDVTQTDRNYATLKRSGNKVVNNSGTVYGTILFEVGTSYGGWKDVITAGSIIDTYVKNAYYNLEGVTPGGKMPSPRADGMIASRAKGKLILTVAPAEGTDPFKYTAVVYQKDENGAERAVAQEEFYTENISIRLPEDVSGKEELLRVEVTAYSMYQDVQPSDVVSVTETTNLPILNNPSIRVDLSEGGNGYRFSLNNLKDYESYGDNWKVVVQFSDNKSVELNQTYPTAVRSGMGENAQQLLVQAVSNTENILDSELISVPAYLPTYNPLALLVSSTMTRTYSVLGTTKHDLAVNVSLNYSSDCEIPPLYRCDLIGTWTDASGNTYNNVVFASNSILIAAKGTAITTFTDLPEYITKVNDLRVRVWYEEAGLGPVYTYSEVGTNADGTLSETANIQILTGFDEQGKEIWKYQNSPVLNDGIFTSCKEIKSLGLTWLPAPVLDAVGERLMPSYENGRLYYTFTWDTGTLAQNGALYRISMTGLDESGNKVSIINNVDVTADQNGGQYKIVAEDWSYSEVEFTITRIGNETQKQIGLTTSGVYKVSKRLPRPGQPTVKNLDVSELNYTIEWMPIAPETGCVSYQVYLQEYDANGNMTGNAVPIGETVLADANLDGFYQTKADLEAYKGKRVQIYVVAQADATLSSQDMEFVNSVSGVTFELEVPKRINSPIVQWIIDWLHDILNYITVGEFEQGGMHVSVQADASSIPQGGSAYLLRGYVYDTLENAQLAVESGQMEGQGLLAVYPGRNEKGLVTSVQMDSKNASEYSHALVGLSSEYAGKWVVYQTRISSGSGMISSEWVTSGIERLPYVKLNAPEVAGDVERLTQIVNTSTNPDIPPTAEMWQAEHHVFSFESGKNAETYYITLVPRDKEGYATQEYRIIENNSEGNIKVFIKAKGTTSEGVDYQEWSELPVTLDNETGVLHTTLSNYNMEINEKYDEAGIYIYYTSLLESTLRAVFTEGEGFRYTLSVPDITVLITPEGRALSETAFVITESVNISASVNANDSVDGIAEGSDAYVTSDKTVILLGN